MLAAGFQQSADFAHAHIHAGADKRAVVERRSVNDRLARFGGRPDNLDMTREMLGMKAELAIGTGLERQGRIASPGPGVYHAVAIDLAAPREDGPCRLRPARDADQIAGWPNRRDSGPETFELALEPGEIASADQDGAANIDAPAKQRNRRRQIEYPGQIGTRHERGDGIAAGGQQDPRWFDELRRAAIQWGGDHQATAAVERCGLVACKKGDVIGQGRQVRAESCRPGARRMPPRNQGDRTAGGGRGDRRLPARRPAADDREVDRNALAGQHLAGAIDRHCIAATGHHA